VYTYFWEAFCEESDVFGGAPPAVLGLVPSVRDIVSKHLDAEAITSQLRTKPDNKVTLWENLKIVSFARLVAGVYACCSLVVFLRVQLSVLGGCMFLDLQKV